MRQFWAAGVLATHRACSIGDSCVALLKLWGGGVDGSASEVAEGITSSCGRKSVSRSIHTVLYLTYTAFCLREVLVAQSNNVAGTRDIGKMFQHCIGSICYLCNGSTGKAYVQKERR